MYSDFRGPSIRDGCWFRNNLLPLCHSAGCQCSQNSHQSCRLRPLARRASFSCLTGRTPVSLWVKCSCHLTLSLSVFLSLPLFLCLSLLPQQNTAEALKHRVDPASYFVADRYCTLRSSIRLKTKQKINKKYTRFCASQSDSMQRSSQTEGRATFSLSGHYRWVINKSWSL